MKPFLREGLFSSAESQREEQSFCPMHAAHTIRPLLYPVNVCQGQLSDPREVAAPASSAQASLRNIKDICVYACLGAGLDLPPLSHSN